MSRLIEEDVAVERISNAIWHLPNEAYPRFNRFNNFDTVHAVVEDAVNGVPTVEPRAKGHWVPQKGGGVCCSECGEYALDRTDGRYVSVSVMSKFCPNCGADMRGEEE